MPSTTREYAVLASGRQMHLPSRRARFSQDEPTPWKTHLLGKPTRSENLASPVPGAMPRLLEVQWPVSGSPHDETAPLAMPHAARIT